MRLLAPFVLAIFCCAGVAFAFGASDDGWGGGDADFGGSGGGSGGDGCGGCIIVPNNLEEDAMLLREDFGERSFQSLQDQQLLGTLCENNFCGALTENQASRLFDRAITYEQHRIANAVRNEAKWLGRIGAVFTLIGLVIAWLAFAQSRDADRRSLKNEIEIEHFRRDKSATGGS